MAFPYISGFSFTGSDFLRENVLRASIWRVFIKKKTKTKTKTKQVETALPILT